MKRLFLSLIFVILLFGITEVLAIANPASTYCENMGYTVQIRTDANGSQYGVCVFNASGECEEWAFYNGSCGQEFVKNLSCASAGESEEPEIECCANLTALSTNLVGPNGICGAITGAYPICSNCGDGSCESWENRCNCVADCNLSSGDDENDNNETDEEDANETEDDKNETEDNETRPACSDITIVRRCIARKDCRWVAAENRCEDNSNLNLTNRRQILKQRLQDYLNLTECPNNCTCAGSTIKCYTENGKVMTVIAGKSGNIIIQVKNINASTNITLIKNESGLFAEINGQEIKIKQLPDEASEKALKRLRMRQCNETNNCSLELKELRQEIKDKRTELRKLVYELQAERHARLLGLFRIKMQVKAQIDAETGEIMKIKKPWWAFLASEPQE